MTVTPTNRLTMEAGWHDLVPGHPKRAGRLWHLRRRIAGAARRESQRVGGRHHSARAAHHSGDRPRHWRTHRRAGLPDRSWRPAGPPRRRSDRPPRCRPGRDRQTHRAVESPGAWFRDCSRPVSPSRSPNPPYRSLGNGLSAAAAVMRGSWSARGLGSCCPVGVTGDRPLLDPEELDPVRRDLSRPGGGGQVAAELAPVPAVACLQHAPESPEREVVQLAGPASSTACETAGPRQAAQERPVR